jgi:hypothetical protein
VHEAGAHRPDELKSTDLSQSERHEKRASLRSSSDRNEPLLDAGMGNVWRYPGIPQKQTLDLGDGDAVPLTLF